MAIDPSLDVKPIVGNEFAEEDNDLGVTDFDGGASEDWEWDTIVDTKLCDDEEGPKKDDLGDDKDDHALPPGNVGLDDTILSQSLYHYINKWHDCSEMIVLSNLVPHC